MNSFQQPNLVHESEAQRQYVRVRLPATVTVEGERFTLRDLSAGGFLMHNTQERLSPNKSYNGQLTVEIDGFNFMFDVPFSALDARSENGLGCRFEHLDPPTADALRHILTAFLAGELVSTGDILHTLHRNNQTGLRNNKKPLAAATGREKLISLLGTLGIFAVGILAFLWVFTTIVGKALVVQSSSAVVTADTFDVVMPASGMLQILVPETAKEVSEGQLLATYQESSIKLDLELLPPETRELAAVLEVPVKEKSIYSPCDCYVVEILEQSGQFAHSNKPVFRLLPKDRALSISARFSQDDGRNLTLGQQIPFAVIGDSATYTGKVVDFSVHTDRPGIAVQIAPSEELPVSRYQRPAEVTLAPEWLRNTPLL